MTGTITEVLAPITPQVQVVLITPEVATGLLRGNSGNRKVSQSKVNTYARSMTEGKWGLTHQGIAVGSDGRLVDGQHRLLAVIQSGVSITAQVTWGMDHFDKVDIGRVRTPGSVLAMAGYKRADCLASSVRLVRCYESASPRPWGDDLRVVADEVVELVQRYPGLEDMTPHGMRLGERLPGGSPSGWAAARHVGRAWAADRDLAEDFEEWWLGLETGAGIPPGDGRLAMASWINGAGRLVASGLRAEILFMSTLRMFHKHTQGESADRMLVRDPARFMFRLPESGGVGSLDSWD